MKQWLINRIKEIVSDVRSLVVKTLLLSLFGGVAGFFVWSETALNRLTQILNIPTPLWVTIILVLLAILYRKKIGSSFLFLFKSKWLVEKNYKQTKTNKDAIVYVKIGEEDSGIYYCPLCLRMQNETSLQPSTEKPGYLECRNGHGLFPI